MLPARYHFNTLTPLNSMLDEFFGNLTSEKASAMIFCPPLDIKEDGKNYYAHIELPGMNKEEVKISIKNNILSIQGEKKQEMLDEKQEYRRVESSFGVFKRCFRLPQETEEAAINAEMENGVLRITIPKADKAEPIQISIN